MDLREQGLREDWSRETLSLTEGQLDHPFGLVGAPAPRDLVQDVGRDGRVGAVTALERARRVGGDEACARPHLDDLDQIAQRPVQRVEGKHVRRERSVPAEQPFRLVAVLLVKRRQVFRETMPRIGENSREFATVRLN